MGKYSDYARPRRSKRLSALGIFLFAAAVVSFLVFYLLVMISNQGYHYIDTDTLELVQTEEIPDGSPTAVIETSLGEIRAVLYPEYAPETVAQFTELAGQGFYDDTYIFEAKNDVYFAGGSADSSGTAISTGRENQERIPRELHQNLWPFRGALCALQTSTDTSFTKRLFKNETVYTGSRFMLLNTIPDFADDEFVTQFREASGSELLADAFLSRGGVPNFSQQVTIFGQAYAGLDVIAQICASELVDSESPQGYTPPKDEIKIISIQISSYGEDDKILNELP